MIHRSARRHVRKTISGLALLAAALCLPADSAWADKVRFLVTDQERLQAHFTTAEQATQRLDVAFAFFHYDDVGRAFLNKLVKAAGRGVKVRFLLDSLNCKLPKGLVAFLVRSGVQVRFYHYVTANPSTWKDDIARIWKRMHDKQVLADGRVLVSGTENMGAPYYKDLVGGTQPLKEAYRGRNLLIEGETAGDAESYFDTVWNSGDVAEPPYLAKVQPEEWLEHEQLLAEAESNLLYFPDKQSPPDPALEFEIDPGSIRFVAKLADKNGGRQGLRNTVIEMLRSAGSRIIIETPYLLPDPEVTRLLVAKARQGVKITVYTNSPSSNNHPIGNALYLGAAHQLESTPGITVKQWDGDETVHGKTIIVDDDQVLVSSMNLNLRSFLHDSESGVYMRSRKAAAAAESDINTSRFSRLPKPGFVVRCTIKLLESLLLPTRSQW